YEKYLCKNDCGSDDKRVFAATISDLSCTDAGKYWCGVTRTGKDIYTEVILEVEQGSGVSLITLSVFNLCVYSLTYCMKYSFPLNHHLNITIHTLT
uniref:Immunoglobulin V-set domain-containing protein n=1 Tax=Sander lucioperca TaxID=283035 RepID=A0A8C9WXE0_SANLU